MAEKKNFSANCERLDNSPIKTKRISPENNHRSYHVLGYLSLIALQLCDIEIPLSDLIKKEDRL